MFYIDKILDNEMISVKDTKDDISEVMTKDVLLQFINAKVRVFGYNKEDNSVNSVEYLPLNNAGNYISVATALESYKKDNMGLDEGDFVVRYMNSIDFRMKAKEVTLHNSRTSNKGVKERTLINRARIEVQGRILASKNFKELKEFVRKKGVFESGRYRYYDDWSQLEYIETMPNKIFWRVRMD